MDISGPNGSLIVRASTASGAIPLEGVTVTVQGKDEEISGVFFSTLTRRDGTTPRLSLPTAKSSLSEAPMPESKPYLSYNIEVYMEGYYPQHYTGVPIFENVIAIQNARMIPVSETDLGGPHARDGEIFEEYENPYL